MSEPLLNSPQSRLSFDINPRELNLARRNFLAVNQERIDRTQRSLNSRQQVFLDALPLLLHTNHPLLPGYVSGNTPCGVSGFEPNKHHIRAVKNIVKSFNYNTERRTRFYIHNLSLMGSCGTIAHSSSSDMDFWVCYDPETSSDLLDELEQKLRGIEKWAATLGIEAYFFPMNLDEFKGGQRKSVSGEDCGSAQHYLLLDEFYRTSLLIAGRMPLWWMVPVQYERYYNDCIATLRSNKLLEEEAFCDFGGIPTIPAGEFIGAGMWQLYKGVESPYKSVIKILLTEVYASEYPHINCLSHIYKDLIYKNTTDINALDPYVMLYRKLEQYLVSRDEEQRLELIRRCFYFKANEPMGRAASKGAIRWRRKLMEQLIEEWDWKTSQLAILDSRKHWKVHRAIIERKALVNELNHSYRFLSRFARDYKSSIKISQQDMTVLGRKLYAAFERKSGKIELVNPNITKHITEDELTFVYKGSRSIYSKSNIWVIYSGQVELDEIENLDAIKRGRSIIELIGWCYFNDILSADTRISLKAPKSDISEHEIQRIIQTFYTAFPDKLSSPPQENFHSTHRPLKNLLFVNVGIDPMYEWNKKGLQKITNQTDAFNYSGMHTNLVQSIELITINSWHEVLAAKFDGDDAIIHCVTDFMRSLPPQHSSHVPQIDVLCYCQTRPEAISKRIHHLFDQIIDCFYKKGGAENHHRFLLEIENHFHLFEFKNHQPVAHYLSNYSKLLKHLSKPNKQFSPMVLDTEALKGKDARTVCRKMTPNTLQVFFSNRQSGITDIFVVDELGSIQQFSCPKDEHTTYLSHLYQFLQSIWYRLESELGRGHTYRKEPILFYELLPGHSKEGKVNTIQPNQFNVPSNHFYTVEVIAQPDEEGETRYTIYCNHKEFSDLEHGDQLFQAVAKHILSKRQNNRRYPIYITDIDLSKISSAETVPQQTGKYLQYKLALEAKLNNALKETD